MHGERVPRLSREVEGTPGCRREERPKLKNTHIRAVRDRRIASTI